jgi:hypothetical protein
MDNVIEEWGIEDAIEAYLDEQLEYWLHHVRYDDIGSIRPAGPTGTDCCPLPRESDLGHRMEGETGSRHYTAVQLQVYANAFHRALRRAVRYVQTQKDMLDGDYDIEHVDDITDRAVARMRREG